MFFAYHHFTDSVQEIKLMEGSDFSILDWYTCHGNRTDRYVVAEYIIPEGAD